MREWMDGWMDESTVNCTENDWKVGRWMKKLEGYVGGLMDD